MKKFSKSRWIWDQEGIGRNRWLVFRKRVPAGDLKKSGSQGKWSVHITADARYRLEINGQWIGDGPCRSWPDELYYDSYDITPYVKTEESLEILLTVNHQILGSGYYIGGEPGVALDLIYTGESGDVSLLVSDTGWDCAVHPGFSETVTKISNGLGYAEVFNASFSSGKEKWLWRKAEDCGPAITGKRKLIPRDIPALADNPLSPVGVVYQGHSRKKGVVRSVDLRPLVFPGQRDVDKNKRFSGVLTAGFHAVKDCRIELGVTVDPHDTQPIPFEIAGQSFMHENGKTFSVDLKKGVSLLKVYLSGEFHDPVFHFQFVLSPDVSLMSQSGRGEGYSVFTFFGPYVSVCRTQAGKMIPPVEDDVLPMKELFEKDLSGSADNTGLLIKPVPESCVSPHHAALESITAIRKGSFTLGDPAAVPESLSWTKGQRYEMILDFGREVSGFLEFQLVASEGTIVDFFCFESVHDGFIEHTYSLNNSLRYIAGEGQQFFSSFLRRGFRYIMVSFREGNGSAILKKLILRERLYPLDLSGTFRCSDPLLNDIWKISRQTVVLCSEDTYVDCPAYEQAYWTGDARNTALFTYQLSQAGPLFLRSARLAGKSLDRSELIESLVPSGWQNVIPSWSFLHVIAGAEYLFYQDDPEGFREIFPSLFRNMKNARDMHIPLPSGEELFAMYAWNLIDWAPMDVPDDGVIAHQNALFVLACRKLAEAAEVIGKDHEARILREWGDAGAAVTEKVFWSDEKRAFRDSLKRDGTPSRVFSHQTQIMMYLADISPGKKHRLEELIKNPPEDFVRIASPFVLHFLFEALSTMGQSRKVIDHIRDKWGYMLKNGATTCWEGWELIPGHFTRSHCHAWSAAPVYFLPGLLLGIKPVSQGLRKVLIDVQDCGLEWAEGSIPTPFGLLKVSWKKDEGGIHIDVTAPEEVSVKIKGSD